MARDESPQPWNRFCGPLVLQSAAAAMADTMMPGHGCTRPRTSPAARTPKRRAGTQSSGGSGSCQPKLIAIRSRTSSVVA